ncbi:MAG TPA: GNAT family N-acetyltransferase [Streptosporangiaceae bacterium]|nr:GNAT family N-acetyltransferase [Streptosporangiaceae bacterium]
MIVGPEWTLRPAGAADTDALRVFLTGLSLRTRYLRFFAGVLPVTPAFLRRMSGVTAGGDLVDALVVTEDCVVIGHGMATDTRDDAGRPVTELAVVVADEHRGRGAGSALIRALTVRAQARGASTLLLDVLAENREMLDLVAHYFPAAGYRRSGPYLTIRVPLPAPFPDPFPAVPEEEQPCEPSIASPGDGRRGRGSVRGGAGAHLPVG